MSAVWTVAQDKEQTFPQLQTRLDADTVIVGAGATGLATALTLADAGRHVVVLEALKVAAGSTGGSTGNLYTTLSQGLSPVRHKWGDAVIQEVVALRTRALDFVEDAVERFSIDCQFARRPLHFVVSRPDSRQERKLQAEYEASDAAGLGAFLTDKIAGLPFPVHRALRIENQAQYNPLAFSQGLAQAVTELGGLIFENSRVVAIDADQGIVTTEHGEVHAEHIVQATHTPKGVNLLQAEMEPYREYGVAVEQTDEDQFPGGIFWMLNEGISLRGYSYNNRNYKVAVGKKHTTGHGTLGKGYYRELEAYLHSHFGTERTAYQWSAQQYQAADLLPYIGRSAHSNVYVGTGYAADGLTWGTVAAGIISNQILGRESRGERLFNPRRFTPLKSVKGWAKENSSVTMHLFKDRLSSAELSEVEAVAPGEGRIVSFEGDKLAIFRSADGTLNVLSPVCPHLKCHVHWNNADSTWDCPCHGSRFAPDGHVLEGPSFDPLPARKL